jgi:hypothetical protein
VLPSLRPPRNLAKQLMSCVLSSLQRRLSPSSKPATIMLRWKVLPPLVPLGVGGAKAALAAAD